MFLIGNKLDEAQHKREVESFSVESVMEGHHIDRHFEMSAKTGENIESSFIEMCRALMKRNKTTKLKEPPNVK